MKTKAVKTYTADIYCGLQEGYGGKTLSIAHVQNVCGKYCDQVGLGLTITPTTFVYTDGAEDGAIIGLINYPRFPSTNEEIKKHAETLVEELLERFNQHRISVVYSDETIMYEV